MRLYVRDERLNQLAEQAQKILKAPTKTYRAMGTDDPDFNQETFLDEMWGDT
jgi:antitoxin VapB